MSLPLSIRAIAKKLGRSDTAIRKWLRHPAWPFARTGPWDDSLIPKIRAWAAANLSPDPARDSTDDANHTASAADAITKSKAQTLVAVRRAKKIEVETGILQKNFHNAQICRQRHIAMLEDLKRRFLGIPDSLPIPVEYREMVRARLVSALNQFATGINP